MYKGTLVLCFLLYKNSRKQVNVCLAYRITQLHRPDFQSSSFSRLFLFKEVSVCPNNKVKERMSLETIRQIYIQWCDLELRGAGAISSQNPVKPLSI